MIVIRNNIFPLGTFNAMNILGVLFIREGVILNKSLLLHEKIHSAQQYEILTLSALVGVALCNIWASWWYMLAVVAMPIVVYVVAWVVALLLPPYDRAYRDTPFEREAYANQYNPDYLTTRTPFAWLKYWR